VAPTSGVRGMGEIGAGLSGENRPRFYSRSDFNNI
jgi:hypothetical protein